MSDKINACFISYRHTDNPDSHKFVQLFVQNLRKHLTWYLPNNPIYFDEDGSKIGDQFNEELAYQLCRSSSMIMFFSPNHFDPKHPYCAQEYHAMLKLEQKRLNTLGNDLRNCGLIFPVIFRGLSYLPEEIANFRQYENFETIVVESDLRKRKFQEKINALCQSILERHNAALRTKAFDVCDCTTFRFPPSEEIMPWLEMVSPLNLPPQMPGR
ncbi:toll/interleukin-1 receptor domain-containing protein [Nitrospira sp. T9]|uniref:toll/interleukin-1 receptor domain-containing protein n=1 Tax=unclassified Nitrospira TaxID=2652172 RepID=UPI003F94915E